ncbi:MAG: hypothetical protein U9R16_05330 [Campylobacterota bacterium]|nr:hypothetical protein [Campylobacterota bacterium]
MSKWYKNKILGDFAESICESHFNALGYHVEYTGVEKFAQMLSKFSNESTSKSITAEIIMNTLHKTPDLLISRIYENELQSYMIEVKYRNKVDDMVQLENQLLWNYRHIIWNTNIFKHTNFTQDEVKSWNSNEDSFDLIQKVKSCNTKHKCINLPIIFYLVVKHPEIGKNHIYCNLATFPRWWNVGDKAFDTVKNGTYNSNNNLNQYKNFNEVYFHEIEPALKQIFN